jgi:hypothetical protein
MHGKGTFVIKLTEIRSCSSALATGKVTNTFSIQDSDSSRTLQLMLKIIKSQQHAKFINMVKQRQAICIFNDALNYTAAVLDQSSI